MKRKSGIFFALLAIGSGGQAWAEQTLGSITSVFVASLGRDPKADQIRKAIVKRLAKSGRLRIVASPQEADATLDGIALRMKTSYEGQKYETSGGTTEWTSNDSVGVAVHLIGKPGQVLWHQEATTRRFAVWAGEVSDVAARISGGLVDAIGHDKAAGRLITPRPGAGSVGPARRLAAIRTVYVAPLGGDDVTELIREKLIGELFQSGRLRVVDSAGDADATLDGLTRVISELDSHFIKGDHYQITSRYIVRLRLRVHGESAQVLKEIAVESGNVGIWRATSNLAHKAVNEFILACERDRADSGISSAADSSPARTRTPSRP